MLTSCYDFLRHGETQAKNAYIGTTDVALTMHGIEQMRASIVSAQQDGVLWDLIISSPLIRCRRFAENLAAELAVPVIVMPNIAEYDFGEWEGKTAIQVMAEYPGELENFWLDPAKYPPKKAEKLECFAQRIDTAISELQSLHQGKRILVVCHGGVMRYLHCKASKKPLTEMLKVSVSHGQLMNFCFDE